MKIVATFLITASILLVGSAAFTMDMTAMDPSVVELLAPQLVQSAEKVRSAQVRVVGDVKNAMGIELAGAAGVILIPHTGIGTEWPADVTSETGTAFAHLFMSAGLSPAQDGEPIDQSHLRTLTVGDEIQSRHTYILLAVRKVSSADWRLYGYGSGDTPVLDLKFIEAKGPGKTPIALEGKDIHGFNGTVVLTLFDKLQVKYPNVYSKKNRYAALDKDTKTADQ